jgi:hypothetical protein
MTFQRRKSRVGERILELNERLSREAPPISSQFGLRSIAISCVITFQYPFSLIHIVRLSLALSC